MPGSGTTPAQLFPIPLAIDNPDVVDDVGGLAKAIEKRVIGVYATTADRDTKTTAAGVEEGMFAFTKDSNRTWYYTGSAWVGWPPQITSGSSVPANSVGTDGDVFFKV